jgi:mRNA-degrading endonuclease toxin of MazEF toxin-antitoxin module
MHCQLEGWRDLDGQLSFQRKPGSIALDQIHTLDRVRLVERLGVLRPPTLQTLQAMFAP